MTLTANIEQAQGLSGDFAAAVVAGFSQARKHIPCRFLYDARGSALFEEITRLDEYYPTRTEIALLRAHGREIASRAGAGCAVVEFGSGSSRKTHILLEHMDKAAAYVPVDIDNEALTNAGRRLRARFPELPVYPVHADFSQAIALPREIENAPKLGFFPGSTIGNFELDAAVEFLARAGELLGAGSGLLIGADLQKDSAILLAAYDDARGVTARFTLNLIDRINRELAGDLDVTRFAHRAIYNDRAGRIEIYIESRVNQHAEILGQRFSFRQGERIHIENSYKYTVQQFQDLARRAKWRPERIWTDAGDLFSLHYFTRA